MSTTLSEPNDEPTADDEPSIEDVLSGISSHAVNRDNFSNVVETFGGIDLDPFLLPDDGEEEDPAIAREKARVFMNAAAVLAADSASDEDDSGTNVAAPAEEEDEEEDAENRMAREWVCKH